MTTVRAERLRTQKQGPPEDDFPGKPLAMLRRIGDLNPGWDHSQTALAVRRHRPD